MSERRRHARQSIGVPLCVRAPDNGPSRWVEARDVSDTGLSFETRRPLSIEGDTLLYVEKLGGELSDAARIEARVVHAKRDEDTGRFRVGLEITGRWQLSVEQLEERITAWTASESG